MHGTNLIRKLEKDSGETLQVREIFYTLQGEGPFAGSPAIFVRLTGCHLACTFCDTVWDDSKDEYKHVNHIVKTVDDLWAQKAHPQADKLVVLTGGEPTRQNIDLLLEALAGLGYLIQIETAGSFWRERMSHPNVFIVVSPKTSVVHSSVAEWAKAYKYIIRANDRFDEVDGLPFQSTQSIEPKLIRLARPPEHMMRYRVYLSPCDEGKGNEAVSTANIRHATHLALTYGYILCLQLHKLVGLD